MRLAIKCQNGCSTMNTYNIQEVTTGAVKAICMDCVKKISLPKKPNQMWADLDPKYEDWDEK